MPENFPGVYVEELSGAARTISGVATSITAFIGRASMGPVNQPVVISSYSDFERTFGGLWLESSLGYAVRDFYLNGGDQAIIVRLVRPAEDGSATDGGCLELDDFIGAGKEDAGLGLYSLDRVDLFNLLCIPPYLENRNVDAGLLTAATLYCQKRRAMLIIDPPSDWSDAQEAVAGLATDIGINSSNAALYFPRLRQQNPLRDDQLEDFAPCGAVAGVIARIDATRGVWKAPAGQEANLAGGTAPSLSITSQENDKLNRLGINCLRQFPTKGLLVWGARTRKGEDGLGSEWKYIPVRRTALFLEESLNRGLKWVLFEPNDEPLWAQIRLSVGAFMHDLFRRGAFQGMTPREAYFVKCDQETTTQNDIDSGFVNILAGFAPLKPAEFVIIRLQQMARKPE
jgi:Bacteriophage tail sheath protein